MHDRVPPYAKSALLWALAEVFVLVGASILDPRLVIPYPVVIINGPLFVGLTILFGMACLVSLALGDDIEGVTKALFVSQIVAVPISSVIIMVLAPPTNPSVYGAGGVGGYQAAYFLALGLMSFMTSMAGTFSGWVLNSVITTNKDYFLDWKSVALGLGLAVLAIVLPFTPFFLMGLAVVAASVAATAVLGSIIVVVGLRRRIAVVPSAVGSITVAGLVVFLLSAFSVSYVYWNFASKNFLVFAQCLTVVAPSLVLLRLLIRGADFGDIDYSSGWDRRKTP